MTGVGSIEVADTAAAYAFYAAAFGVGSRVCASQARTTGFRGFAMSPVTSQPSTVHSYDTDQNAVSHHEG